MKALARHPEKQIEWDIIQALRTMGFAVTKTSQHQKPRGMSRGIPDLYVSHPVWGLRCWVEVKRPGERPSLHQVAWHEQERAAGGRVVVATGVADVVLELGKMGAPIS